jgi:peptidoglycan/xylan/chitin deacetylase (PgdA/CDA1 family)
MSYWRTLRTRWRSRTLVLCYHRVTELTRDPFNCCVSPRNFAEHLDVLRALDLVMPFAELIDIYQPRRLPGGRKVIITFDDGYADNLHSAAPLLARQGFHAMFYIFTGWIAGTEEAWWDRLERVVDDDAGTLQPLPRMAGVPGEVATTDRASWFESLYLPLRDTAPTRREEIMATLDGASGRAAEVRPAYRPLTLAELRNLAGQPGVHIGAHTVTHPLLPSLPAQQQQFEIASSREWLERELGQPVRDLAYPHGAESPATRAAAAVAGMKTAVTCEARAIRRTDDPLAIPRVLVHNWDGDEFARRLAGWFTH